MSVESLSTASAKIGSAQESGVMAPSFATLDTVCLERSNTDDLQKAVQRHLVYLHRYGLQKGGYVEQQRLATLLASLARALFPLNKGAQLDIVVDALAWSIAWSEHCVSLRNRDRYTAEALTWQVVELTLQYAGAKPERDASPLAWAFMDLWKREAAGMSPYWQERAVANWRRWLLCLVSDDRFGMVSPGPYLSGHQAMDWFVLSDLIEGSLKFELPLGIRETIDIQTLLDMYAHSNQWLSDISAAQAGDVSHTGANSVFWLQQMRDCSSEQAMHEVLHLHGRSMERWRLRRTRLPRLYAVMRLDAEEQREAERYVTGLELLIAGYCARQRPTWRWS